MSRPNEATSLIHRILGLQPGTAPLWLCAADACIGLDVPVLALGGATAVGVIFFRHQPVIALLLIALCVVIAITLILPFDTCERKARARRRQQEEASLRRTSTNHERESHS